MRLYVGLIGSLVGIGSLALGACGDPEPELLDPSTFSGMNEDKIRFDCQHTVQCASQRGEQLPEDPVNSCVRATARLLETNPGEQMLYLSNISRCQGYVVCDYNDCALLDVQGGYGQSQIEKVRYKCHQDVECRRVTGATVTDPMMELDSCIANNVGLLDRFTAAQRTQYEAAFTSCTGRVACDFGTCFQF
jgi:hypothetical protein